VAGRPGTAACRGHASAPSCDPSGSLRVRLLAVCGLLCVGAVWRPATAQDARITGTVTADGGGAIPQASITLFDSAGVAPVARGVADSAGQFALAVAPGRYTLEIRAILFRPIRRMITLHPGRTLGLGMIVLEPVAITLPGVVVQGTPSQIHLSFEKRVFRVGRDIIATGGSVLDLLNNVPSLTTDFRGNVSLRGSTAVRLLINGKPSPIFKNGSRALQSLPADMIAEVQVITNPSAKHEAEGNAGIINIILKKKQDHGFNGTFGVLRRQPPSTAVSANMNYRSGKVNWFLNGSIAHAADPSHSRTYQRFDGPDTAYVYRGVNDGSETDYDGDVTTGVDWHLTSQQVLTASAIWHFENKRDKWRGAYVDSTLTGAFLDQIVRADTIGGGERGIQASLDYERHFGTDAHKLTASAMFDRATSAELPQIIDASLQQPYDTVYHSVDDRRASHGMRVRVDYVRPLPDSGKVQAGVRADFDWQNNTYTVQQRSNGGAWIDLPAFNSNFSVSDYTYSGYATLSSRLGSLSYQFGVRGERYHIRTRLAATGAVTQQTYTDLFPSAFLTYAFNQRQSIQVSYSRRISRPDPRELLPTTDYSASRNRFTGNDALAPEYGDSYEGDMLHSWGSGSLLAGVYYRHRTGVIQEISQLDRNGVLRTTPFNLATANSWGVELTIEEELGGAVKLSLGANLFREKSRGTYEGTPYQAVTNRLTSRIQAEWQVAKGFRWRTAVRYYGPAETIQGHRAGTAFVNMAIAKDFLDGKMTASLSSEDLFGTRRDLYSIVEPTSFSRQRQWEPTGVMLQITYRIGRTGD